MRHFAVFIFVCGFSVFAFAQKEVNIWYFGDKAGLDFNPCSGPVVLNNSALSTDEGTASISDLNGNLLFYTDGRSVYNKNHLVMTNGTGLKGGFGSCSQAALIVPDPGNVNRYYLFTVDEAENNLANGFNYNVIDMTLNAGAGGVVSTIKNKNLLPTCTEKLTAYVNPAGGYWILIHGWGSNNNTFYAYPLTAAGIGTPITTNIGSTHSGANALTRYNASGPMKFSPDGTKVALCIYFNGLVELFDFNTSTGQLSNAKTITIQNPFGLEFSPDNTKLYVAGTANAVVTQFDITLPTANQIEQSAIIVSKGGNLNNTLQLGPNCKIYVTTLSGTLDVINSPNLSGANCNYTPNAINLNGNSSKTSSPNFLRSYFANMSCSSGGTTTVTALSANPVNCNGGNEGTATVSATGCNSPYTYTWQTTPTQTGLTATGLKAGTYTVIATDASNVTSTATVVVTQPSQIKTVFTTVNAGCGNANGSASIQSSSGGNGSAYTYSWSNSNTGTTASNLASGPYTLTMTDKNGCSHDTTFTIGSGGTPTVTCTPTAASCKGIADGTALASGNGCNTPYTYSWNTTPAQNTQTATGLKAGTYTVTATDSKGTTSTASVTISEPAAITITSITTQATTCGSSNGSASVSGSSTYTYSWSNNTIGTTTSNLSSGSHTLTISLSGCKKDTVFTINSIGGPTIQSTPTTPVTCNGGNDGTATVNATGTGFAYSWSPSGGTNAIASNLQAGTYTVTVNDANQCQSTASVQVTQPAAMNISNTPIPASCNGVSDGSITIVASGGKTPYTYSWSNGTNGTNASLSGLAVGVYSVIITDGSGCSTTNAFTITQTGNLNVTAANASVSCFGYTDAALTASPTGGNPIYNYSWSNGSTTSSITSLAAGSYSVTITDNKGCITSSVATVTEPTDITTSVTTTNASLNTANGTAAASVSGGNGPYTYNWLPNNITTSILTNAAAGTYTLAVKDNKGCVDTVLVIIESEIPCYEPYVPTAFSPNNDGTNDVLYVRGACINTFTFQLYNRWGELVFETNDPNKGWNGVFRGQLSNSGVYTYSLKYTNKKGESALLKGNLTLIR